MSTNHKLQLERFLATEAETLELGAQIARGVVPGMVIYLRGDLGAGKTTLARGLLRELGAGHRIKSPTFTLVEPYILSSLYLYHFDFYRFKRAEEWVEAGFRDYFHAASVCLVEWPDKAGDELPAADVAIALELMGSGRNAVLRADTEVGIKCLASVNAQRENPGR